MDVISPPENPSPIPAKVTFCSPEIRLARFILYYVTRCKEDAWILNVENSAFKGQVIYRTEALKLDY